MSEDIKKTIEDKKKEAESLLILGLFSGVIGAVLFFAIFFTVSPEGKIANFLVGLVLFLLGVFIFLKGKKMKQS